MHALHQSHIVQAKRGPAELTDREALVCCVRNSSESRCFGGSVFSTALERGEEFGAVLELEGEYVGGTVYSGVEMGTA
jgi:hypothetical protein